MKFDPIFFNQLPPHLRCHVATKKVALLPDVSTSFSTNPDEKLDDKAFTAKYCDAVFNQYEMVDPNEFESDEDEDEDLEGDGFQVEDDTIMNEDSDEIADKRTTLVAHLSSVIA